MSVIPDSSEPRSTPGFHGSVLAVLPLALGASLLIAGGSSPSESSLGPVAPPAEGPMTAAEAHNRLLAETEYPSARDCGDCHIEIYEEWSSSQHAYSAISPMFHKFEQTLNRLASGTVGAFCVRCHVPVGTTLGEPRHSPIHERAAVSAEGVTCIVCHRVEETYGRVNGERRIEPGSIHDPVHGPKGAPELDQVVSNRQEWGVDPIGDGDGVPIHRDALVHDQIQKSEFCASCHQVAVHPGIKLEVVWEQYRDSPAREQGISCQDCHMGTIPGIPSGYAEGPRAVVNGRPTTSGKHTDHSFAGPGYSIAHPGIFPHNRNNNFSIDEMLKFDFRSDWGKAEWENSEAAEETSFPPEWEDASERLEARQIIDENVAKLAEREKKRATVMENASHIDGPFFEGTPKAGEDLEFSYKVSNICAGHNLPSGSLGAQPEIWLNVALLDPDGENVWESGYVDSRGDMADLHSKDVLVGELEHDDQLFNLQTKFLTTNLKGTDREMYLPVPFDGDQLPFIRPAGQPTTVMNHPPFIRMEQRSIPPLSHKMAKYTVPGELLERPGTYELAVRLRSRAEPIYFMEFVGATQEMIAEMNDRMMDIHPYTVEFDVR